MRSHTCTEKISEVLKIKTTLELKCVEHKLFFKLKKNCVFFYFSGVVWRLST